VAPRNARHASLAPGAAASSASQGTSVEIAAPASNPVPKVIRLRYMGWGSLLFAFALPVSPWEQVRFSLAMRINLHRHELSSNRTKVSRQSVLLPRPKIQGRRVACERPRCRVASFFGVYLYDTTEFTRIASVDRGGPVGFVQGDGFVSVPTVMVANGGRKRQIR